MEMWLTHTHICRKHLSFQKVVSWKWEWFDWDTHTHILAGNTCHFKKRFPGSGNGVTETHTHTHIHLQETPVISKSGFLESVQHNWWHKCYVSTDRQMILTSCEACQSWRFAHAAQRWSAAAPHPRPWTATTASPCGWWSPGCAPSSPAQQCWMVLTWVIGFSGVFFVRQIIARLFFLYFFIKGLLVTCLHEPIIMYFHSLIHTPFAWFLLEVSDIYTYTDL